MAFEDSLQKGLFSRASEKTFIDKILAKDDVAAIREIIKKPRLTRADLLEILNLLSGTESKLLNYSEWDRYVILKFFIWIREFVKARELLYDYRASLERKARFCSLCEKYTDVEKGETLPKCSCNTPKKEFIISDRFDKILNNNELLMEHNAKFLIDLYLNIGRTSLSIGATGLMEILKNKFEIMYGGQGLTTPTQEDRTTLLSRGGKK